MIVRLAERGIRLVLLDIEGTTTPIAFVYDVLFPFARAHLADWIRRHQGTPELAAMERRLADEAPSTRHPAPEHSAPAPGTRHSAPGTLAALVLALMDDDRKTPALKELQGRIWEDGYRAGHLHGEVFPDVAPAMRRWRDRDVGVAIYSSGSELAQRLLFASTPDGDLTPLIAGFFDTRVGAKREKDSYLRIASALGHAPAQILFISDIADELKAARAAGSLALLANRPGNRPQADAADFESVSTFEEIL